MIETKITVKGVAEVQRMLSGLAGKAMRRGALHQRWGILTLQWISRNFQSEGKHSGAPWKKLSINTIAGRRKRSSRVLMDNGLLRQSFTMAIDTQSARVGSPLRTAEFHEYGTRPYSIYPRSRRWLAFPAETGKPMARARTFPSRQRKFPKGTPMAFAKKVNHPGLPARPMLPAENNIRPALIQAAISYLKGTPK